MSAPGDSSLEALIGRVLRTGATTSSVLLGAGLALALVRPGAGALLMNIGVVVLIATPAARVVLSFVEYAHGRDLRFVVLTGLVLLELVAGAVAAIVFHRRI